MLTDDVIQFEITDQDLDNEFNFNSNQDHRKNVTDYFLPILREDVAGVWTIDTDEEENEDNFIWKDNPPGIEVVAEGMLEASNEKEKEKKELQPAEPPTSACMMIVDSSDKENQPCQPKESEIAGLWRQRQCMMKPFILGGNVGQWEKHTKGIGAKLLLQMGYQPGKGLGKNLQGIPTPVEAKVKEGRGAIGYVPQKATICYQKGPSNNLRSISAPVKATVRMGRGPIGYCEYNGPKVRMGSGPIGYCEYNGPKVRMGSGPIGYCEYNGPKVRMGSRPIGYCEYNGPKVRMGSGPIGYCEYNGPEERMGSGPIGYCEYNGPEVMMGRGPFDLCEYYEPKVGMRSKPIGFYEYFGPEFRKSGGPIGYLEDYEPKTKKEKRRLKQIRKEQKMIWKKYLRDRYVYIRNAAADIIQLEKSIVNTVASVTHPETDHPKRCLTSVPLANITAMIRNQKNVLSAYHAVEPPRHSEPPHQVEPPDLAGNLDTMIELCEQVIGEWKHIHKYVSQLQTA